MLRKIIQIDQSRCNGCGLCVDACHEGAIGLVDGRAKLMRDDYCDGLGDCLPQCPMDAISFVERDTVAYDADAVAAAKKAKSASSAAPAVSHGCPGSAQRTFARKESARREAATDGDTGSQLTQWPVQMRLLPVSAPYLDGADLLVAADCTAFSCGDFHDRFIAGKKTIIGCPKLDPVDYTEKLSAMVAENDIRSITVVLMEVPCCRGLGNAVAEAVRASGKDIPVTTTIISTDGRILS